jgi:Predicted flavin-nucleotide-binding protein
MNPQTEKFPHGMGMMRRKDREVTDCAEIDSIIRAGTVMHLALTENNIPFVVPLFYAYDGSALFFHSASAGMKIDILKRNPVVCFAITLNHDVIENELACRFSAHYRTVIGHGRAVFIEDEAEKTDALARIVARFTDTTFIYPPGNVARTAVIRITIDSVKGKKNAG